jgi:ABC-type bacteriocin/lantibiotic exporter with double-glycine peptidase domain
MWEDRQAAAIEQAMRRGTRADGYSTLAATLTMTTQVAMTAVGALAILEQKLTIGALIAAGMLSGRMLAPMSQLVGNWRVYTGFLQSVRRLGTTFALPADRQLRTVEGRRPVGHIVIEDLFFSYPGSAQPVIDGLRLEIASPGLTALVGANGSGKSTLLKLILGLYRPTAGRVLLDGADISQFSRSELAEWIGYLPQECVLLDGSIRDAIACRRPEASDAEVIAAAERAGAHPFIINLADGYGSSIGEGGHRLSSGQRQRLVLARTLLGDPPLVLLDEPSVNLDRQAETTLRSMLIELGRTRSVVIVTHSPLLLSACDSVIILDRGRVAASGPPAMILRQRTQPVAAETMASSGLAGIETIPIPADAPERDHGRRPPMQQRT